MSKWDIDKLICTGLIAALIIFIVGQLVLIFCGRTPLPMELGTTIVAGFIGYMNRSPFDKVQDKPADKPPLKTEPPNLSLFRSTTTTVKEEKL